MNPRLKKVLLAVALLAVTDWARAVDTAYAPPAGGMTIVVQSGQTRSVSLPLIHASVGAGPMIGRITSVGSNFIAVVNAGWVANALSNVANPYYLRFRTGAQAGRTLSVLANTDTQLTLNNDGTDLAQVGVAAGDAFELVLADTLFSLFGNATLLGGPNAAAADNVQVWGGASWLVFYFNTDRNRWERNVDTAASPSRDNFLLRPHWGFMITRRAASDLTLRFAGRVPQVAARQFHTRPGTTFLSDGLPVDITLSALALRNNAGWVEGASPATSTATADLVQVWGGASWQIFYYDTTTGFWRRNVDTATSPSRNGFVIPAGRPVMIKRVAPGASTAESLLALPLPYTIDR